MKNKINVAELLKNCPSGMELDCTLYEDVYFDYVDELNIIHCYIQHETHKTSITLNQHGTPNGDIKSKCVIFPKGKTTWEEFQRPFVDGDILSYQCAGYRNRTIYIYRHHHTMNTSYYVALCGDDLELMVSREEGYALSGYNTTARFATEEEKEKLFDAIKANGYRWDAETKTLEKLPKFKVGDRITNGKTSITIGYIDDEYYYERGIKIATRLLIKNQDDWELVPNKFNIHNLRPFDKVLVRDCNTDKWNIDFFAYYREDRGDYQCMTFTKNQCIPYESNKYLMGTTDSCREYFKTWK